jgi:hypothetical protein
VVMVGLSLDMGAIGEESECLDSVQTPSSQTPTAKRQRRLTLTAMTGLICEMSQEQHSKAKDDNGTLNMGNQPLRQNEVSLQPEPGDKIDVRDPSPVRRLKRSRASISVTASPNVMMARAAKTLQAFSSAKSPAERMHAGSLQSLAECSSDGSESTEDELDTSFTARVRHDNAFQCGSASLSSPTEDQSIENLSPRSKQEFERGVRAAQIAAKVAASMTPETAVSQAPSPSRSPLMDGTRP